MNKTLLIFSLIFSVLLTAQEPCDVPCEKKVKKSKDIFLNNAKYTGCVNLFNQPHGFGTIDFGKQTKSGCWKDGKEHGEFTITFKDGFKQFCLYVDGVEGDCRTLIDNVYDVNDIKTEKNSFDIELISKDLHDFILLKISGKKDVWMYDTGASGNTMTREFFNKLPKYTYKKLYTSKGEKDKHIRFKIADGSYAKVEFYLIDKITIQDIEVHNVVFGVHKKGGSNLIGNDFWNKFSKKFPPNDGKIKVVK